ncbi:hypothetical protein BG006_008286 [Podila minutissima]|uniref:Increased recombination centers protein 6 n=1 Tax=Podila minutissima TaxID=64525 RepID=A0A9P5SFY7_9FUNG|nr:hypothetical protein BG006_008286 [Podila minutissima]
MLPSENPPRNKILVVGRRGVGKLSLVQSILGSRIIPTTSVSKSRPSSPLILPAIPVPTLEETIMEENSVRLLTPPITTPTTSSQPYNVFDIPSSQLTQQSQASNASQQQQQQDHDPSTPGRAKLDHSGVTIPWTIDTKYYSVKVDFWIDETYAQGRTAMEQMVESGELDELGSVVEAVVFCFSKNQPATFHDIKPWLSFVERHEPSITLCVATTAPAPQPEEPAQTAQLEEDNEVIEDYDDWCLANGFEFIDLQEQPESLGQEEHVGLDRILEALAAHMWDGLKRKSSKKREQHERSMMMSFQDDDVDMTFDSSWRESGSRRFDISDLTGQEPGGEDENEDDDDDDEDDDDDRAFYKAIAELNLRKPHISEMSSYEASQGSVSGVGAEKQNRSKSDDDDDFDFDSQELVALEKDELEIWSSEKLSTSQPPSSSIAPIDQALEQQFREFLGQPGGSSSSGRDFAFELKGDDEFEFGDYVQGTETTGQDDLFGFDVRVRGKSTPKQESIKAMHKALFSNIDEEDGMAQAVATLQGLREQGKTMNENDRRELAARVALSFGMQMG